MSSFWLLLLYLSFIRVIDGELNFPEDIYPKDVSRAEFRVKCPFESNRFDFCIPKYENCIGMDKLPWDCHIDFTECVLKNDEFKELGGVDSCSKYSENARVFVSTRGDNYKKAILRKKRAPVIERIRNRLEPIDEGVEQLAEACGIQERLQTATVNLKGKVGSTNELLEFVAKYFALFEVSGSMSKAKRCRDAEKGLAKAAIVVDDISAKNLHLPYDFTHIGAEFGAMGKMAMRVIADEACEKATIDFNHLSAVRLNCYDQQKPREGCDRKYMNSMKRVLKTMDSKKASCSMFVDLVSALLPVRAAQFYKEAANYHAESSMVSLGGKLNRGFSAFLNGSITGRDTRNTILRLDASEKTSLRFSNYYDQVSSECGSVRRSAGVVSSCGFKYEYCTMLVQSACEKQLSICLNDIDDMNDACRNAVAKIDSYAWLTTEDVPRPTVVPEAVEILENSDLFVKTASIGVFAFLFFLMILVGLIVYKRMSKRQKTSNISSSHTSMTSTFSKKDVIEKDESGELLADGGNDAPNCELIPDAGEIQNNQTADEPPRGNNETGGNNNESMKYDEYLNSS